MSLLVFSRTDERHDSLVHKGTKTHLKLFGDGAHFISCKQEDKTIVLNQEWYLVKVFFLNLRNNGNFAMFIFFIFYFFIWQFHIKYCGFLILRVFKSPWFCLSETCQENIKSEALNFCYNIISYNSQLSEKTRRKSTGLLAISCE